MADVTLAALFGEHPGPRGPGWVVPNVLRVAAIQVGDPVRFLVLMKSCDPANQRGLEPFLNVMVMSAVLEFGRGSVRVLAS